MQGSRPGFVISTVQRTTVAFALTALVAPCFVGHAQAQPNNCGNGTVAVSNTQQLAAATADPCTREIDVQGSVASPSTVALHPGQHLIGVTGDAALVFPPGIDGVSVTTDNAISQLRIQAAPVQRAVFNDTTAAGLGTLALTSVSTSGQVQLLVTDQVHDGNVQVNGLDIAAADTSTREKPQYQFYGSTLQAMQGAFTLWNRQPDATSVVAADLRGITVGRPDAPVIGSGVEIFGAAHVTAPSPDGTPIGDVLHNLSTVPTSGSVKVATLDTGALYTNGGAVPVTPNASLLGSAAVFVGAQAPIQTMHIGGPLTTIGLDAGGTDIFSDIGEVTYDGPVETSGPTGIAIVSWPYIGTFNVNGSLTTHGAGARAFNAYAGHIGTVNLHDVHTDGAGSPAIDVFAAIDNINVSGKVEANGTTGPSLVLGHYTTMPSNAIRVSEGGNVNAATVNGPIVTTAPDTAGVLVGQNSRIGKLCAAGGIQATGAGSQPVDNSGTLVQACPAS